MLKIYKSILFIGLASIIVFSPIAKGAARIWSITPLLLIEYFLLFVWAVKSVNIGYQGPKSNLQSWLSIKKANLPLLLFILLAIDSFIFSGYKHDSFFALITLFGYVGMYYLVAIEIDRKIVKWLSYIVITVGASLSVYGILQYFNIFDNSWWADKEFLAATFVNHNHFAGYLELIIPLVLSLLMTHTVRKLQPQHAEKKSLLYRLMLIISLVVMIAAFILAQSRGGWTCLGLSLLIMFIVMIRGEEKNKKKFVILLLLILSVIVFAYFSKDLVTLRMQSVTNIEAGDASLDTRLKIWQGAWESIQRNPLVGTGIGTFVKAFIPYRTEGLIVQANFAHNDYLEMAVDMGLAAPFLMIWFVITIVFTGFKNKGHDPYMIGCAVGVLSLALHGIIDFNFHIPSNMLLFIIWCGIVARYSEPENKNVKRA